MELFKDFKDLPWPTRILIGTSGFFSRTWYWMLLGAGLAGAVLTRLTAHERGRLWWDRFRLTWPVAGHFWLRQDVARFARTLALLLDSGIPIERALGLAAATLNNRALCADMEKASGDALRQGNPLSAGLRTLRWLPGMVSDMCAVGEESGHLEGTLEEIAAFFEAEIEQQSRVATSLLEPVLILVVGGVVGFIVAAMLLPVFRLTAAF